jgi:hypothetical protein
VCTRRHAHADIDRSNAHTQPSRSHHTSDTQTQRRTPRNAAPLTRVCAEAPRRAKRGCSLCTVVRIGGDGSASPAAVLIVRRDGSHPCVVPTHTPRDHHGHGGPSRMLRAPKSCVPRYGTSEAFPTSIRKRALDCPDTGDGRTTVDRSRSRNRASPCQLPTAPNVGCVAARERGGNAGSGCDLGFDDVW